MRSERSWGRLGMKSKLSDICHYVKGKVDVSGLDNVTYISTENMLPDKGGVTEAATLPNTAQAQIYEHNDVLVSNIRPYFKKIWFANQDGGCSNDVLVFRANEGVEPGFLYYVLADEKFFNYSMATSKGTKMPRGDKKTLMEYEVPDFDIGTQRKVASLLGEIDEKIITNNEINKNLEQQLELLYEDLSSRDSWPIVPIDNIAKKIAMGPFGSNIKVATFVESGVPIISGNHLRGLFLEEPSFNYITERHAQQLKNSIVYPRDIVFTHAGNIGQVAMIPEGCRYSCYILSQRQFYLRCDLLKAVPEYVLLFFHSIEGQHELLSYANQTGVPSIAQPASNLKKIELPLPPIEVQTEWLSTIQPIIDLYQNKRLESSDLAALRDTLLPRLMSGELDVSNLEL